MQPGQVAAGARDRLPGEDVFLASIAGYVDTLGFVALFGLFTAHVTGNFILIGSGLTGVGQGLLIKWLAFPAFIAGSCRPPARPPDARARSCARAGSLYALQAILLAGFMFAGIAASPIGSADAPATIVRAARRGGDGRAERAWPADRALGGRQHGDDRQRHAGRHRCLRLARADRRAGRTGRRPRARLQRTLPPVAGFALGAGAGATAYLYAAFWASRCRSRRWAFTYRSARLAELPASR